MTPLQPQDAPIRATSIRFTLRYIIIQIPLSSAADLGMKLPLPLLSSFSRTFQLSIYTRLPRKAFQFRVSLSHLRTYSSPTIMETIKQTIAQNLGNDKSHQLVPEDQQFALDQTPSLDGKVAVITGGSQGIGYGCSHTLLSKGLSKLFILSLTKDVVDGATDAIKEEMGEEIAKKVSWLECDLSDWHAVKATADKIASSTDRIDILINNAGRGIMTYQLTSYGVDRHVSRGEINSFTSQS